MRHIENISKWHAVEMRIIIIIIITIISTLLVQ